MLEVYKKDSTILLDKHLFKVNNEDNTTTSEDSFGVSLLLTLNVFLPTGPMHVTSFNKVNKVNCFCFEVWINLRLDFYHIFLSLWNKLLCPITSMKCLQWFRQSSLFWDHCFVGWLLNPLSANPTKWSNNQTIRRLLLTNCYDEFWCLIYHKNKK